MCSLQYWIYLIILENKEKIIKLLGPAENQICASKLEKTCSHVFGALHKIRLCGHFMSKNLKHRLVQSLVMPYFRYCDVIYSDMATALESKLHKEPKTPP